MTDLTYGDLIPRLLARYYRMEAEMQADAESDFWSRITPAPPGTPASELVRFRRSIPNEKEKAMKTYIGIKRVEAEPGTRRAPISAGDPLGQNFESGYHVRYEDGYTSWSPAEAFEAAYTAMPDDMKPAEIDDTLEVLRESLEYLIAPEDRPMPDRPMPPPGFGMEFHNTAAERRQWAFEAAADVSTNSGGTWSGDEILAYAVKLADFVEGVTVSAAPIRMDVNFPGNGLTPVAEPS